MNDETKEIMKIYRGLFGLYDVFLASDGFGLLVFNDKPDEGRVTFATWGLSQVDFPEAAGGILRQELLLVLRTEDCTPEQAVGALTRVVEHSRRYGVRRRGEIHRFDVPFLPKVAGVTDVYVAQRPPDSDSPPEISTGSAPSSGAAASSAPPSITLRCVLPLLPQEADFLEVRDWNAFERRMVENDADFTDLRRSPFAARPFRA